MTEASKKARITLPTGSMKRVKSVSGGVSFHCGDTVAEKLSGLPLEQVRALAATMDLPHEKYAHLNPGQQRMNIGNLIRAKVRKDADAGAVFEDAANGVREAYEAQTAVARQEAADAAALKKAKREAAAAEAQRKREEKAAEREAKKADAERLKAEKAAQREQKKAEREAAKAAAKEAKAAAKAEAAAE